MLKTTLLKSKFIYWIAFLYLGILVWWIKLQINGVGTPQAYLFNWSYGLISISGFVYGVYISTKKWGGMTSSIGRGIIFLAVGLLGQWFGLQVWTYYNIIAKVDIPYPSLADFGYFALIPAYTYSAILFVQAAGGKFSLRTLHGKLLAILIPLTTLIISYLFFLKEIGYAITNPVKLFFDIGYPLGEIIPASIAIFALYLSKDYLGGRMKKRILFLVFAFFFQFVTEYTFLYRAGAGLYVNGGLVDLMYATSYTIMTLVFISFSNYE